MLHCFTVRPLSRERIPEAFPVVAFLDDDITAQQWSSYASAVVAETGQGGHGIMTLQDRQSRIVGLSAYHIRPDLQRGRVLILENFAVACLTGARQAAATLLAAMERLACDQGCAGLDTGLLHSRATSRRNPAPPHEETGMTDIIEQIRNEHRNMGKLLDTLERQIAVFSEGGKPDYEIIVGAIDYFLDYPDRCHHPKEDLLARKILEGADTAGPLQKLEAQHEELGILSRRFAQLVHRVLDEAELSRSDLTRAATEFIATQRHHMEMEEEHFLPLAEAALSQEDLAALDSELTAEADPLMDPDAEARYASLRDAILSWEAEAHG